MTQRERQAEVDRLMDALTTGDPIMITEGGNVRKDIPDKADLVGDDDWWDDPNAIADVLGISGDEAIDLYYRLRGD
jgi:hypothetical protein